MAKYDRDAAAVAATSVSRDKSRPDCVVNVSEVAAEPYERAGDGIAGASRDIGDAAGTRLLGVDVTEIPPGRKSSHLHSHSRKEEFFLVLSGRCRLTLGDRACELREGDAVARPAGTGVAHRFENPYDQPCRVLMCGVMAGRGVEDTVEWPELGRRLVIDAEGKRKVVRVAA